MTDERPVEGPKEATTVVPNRAYIRRTRRAMVREESRPLRQHRETRKEKKARRNRSRRR